MEKRTTAVNTESPAPFSCRYTPRIPELLVHLNCSIALSTYQAGKLIFISAKDEDTLVQLPRHFNKVMGIAEDPGHTKLALACKDEVIVFANSPGLAYSYPKAPQRYDSLYMPRLTYHTGPLDIHDLNYGRDGSLYAVNTLFSCIISLDDNYSFTPLWMPPFIDKLVSEDRCHLNGMAMKDGKPKYVTCFNTGNEFQSWRNNIPGGGVVIDMESNEIIADDLEMPHSPGIFGNDLYLLLSAKGELIKVDVKTGKYDTVLRLDGFLRGMSLYKDYLFIGVSRLRKNTSAFAELPIVKKARYAGIYVVHLPTGSIAGQLSYLNSLEEIYDIHILPGKRRPNILNTLTASYKEGLSTPKASFWAKKE